MIIFGIGIGIHKTGMHINIRVRTYIETNNE